jgi:hypothetical protein
MPNEYQQAKRTLTAAWKARPEGLTGRLLEHYLLAAAWSSRVRERTRRKVINELLRRAG